MRCLRQTNRERQRALLQAVPFAHALLEPRLGPLAQIEFQPRYTCARRNSDWLKVQCACTMAAEPWRAMQAQ